MTDRIKDYECCALYRPDVDKEGMDEEVGAIQKLIENAGGEIQRIDRWNKRMLAYPIRDCAEGLYVIYRWFGDGSSLDGISYHLRYSDNCMRHMVIDYTEKERKRRKRRGKNETAEV